MYERTVLSADDEFVVILSDPETGADACAWSGSADALVAEFQSWLARRRLLQPGVKSVDSMKTRGTHHDCG